MRYLLTLFACCLVVATASANAPPVAQAPAPSGAAKAAAEPAKAGAVAGTGAGTGAVANAAAATAAKPAPAAPLSASVQRAREEALEAELAAKIATRLAAMRANQVARMVAAAKAKKLAESASKEAQMVASEPPAPRQSKLWSYEGETGPANWGRINAAWAKCGAGLRQSPIDLRDGMKVDLEQIAFDYHPSAFSVTDTGHTIEVATGLGNYITVQNRTYELVQFHFHRPSEERINGKGTEMVVHLEHKDAEGRLAIVAVLLERGAANPLIQTVWNNLPLEKNDIVTPSVVVDVGEILPQRREYFTFMGSMTTPPCSEGVLWLVMKQPMPASAAQMALFGRLYPLNARPPQAHGGRVIKESN